jgi:hypothetical protein
MSFHGDPGSGYVGPLLRGLACSYQSPGEPPDEWTVPQDVSEARFALYGGADSVSGKRGGRVAATFAVAAGQTYVLEPGHDGGASTIGLEGTPLLVAGGGDGAEPNYVDPSAADVENEPPGAPLGALFALDGAIYVSWLEGWYDGRERDTTDRPLDPAGKNRKTTDLNRRCIVPRLKGRKRAAARRALENRGCKVGRVEHRPARRSKQGRIVAQQPPPETVLPIDAGVDFVIGRAD